MKMLLNKVMNQNQVKVRSKRTDSCAIDKIWLSLRVVEQGGILSYYNGP